jgi:hypothetical protein
VYNSFDALPVESTVITEGSDRFGPVFLHELADSRPFAHLVYTADVVDSAGFARALLADSRYEPRTSVILEQAPLLTLPDEAPDDTETRVISFEPERIEIEVDTSENAILTLAHPYYPGWQATLDGEDAALLRAYGGFSALEVPAGGHTLTLLYRPLSFVIGAAMSILTWAALAVIGLWEVQHHAGSQ